MALSKTVLKDLIETELEAQGFTLDNEFCYASKMATAIANAVVAHITSAAIVNTTGADPQGGSVTSVGTVV